MMLAHLQAMKAQAQAMIATIDLLMALPEPSFHEVGDPCLHPDDKRMDASTMGRPREVCMQCHTEVPQSVVTE